MTTVMVGTSLRNFDDSDVDIELHTAPTPNGWKISIALEEMTLPYAMKVLSFKDGDLSRSEFLEISPNGRIPAIVDRRENNLSVFESGAILIYLAERSGQFLPTDPQQRKAVFEWLMFQMSGVGPNFGQAFTFKNYPTPVPEAYKRFVGEAVRLCGVLNQRLDKVEYIAGDYSIADMALFPWLSIATAFDEIEMVNFPQVGRWLNQVGDRQAVQIGCKQPEPYSDEARKASLKAALATD